MPNFTSTGVVHELDPDMERTTRCGRSIEDMLESECPVDCKGCLGKRREQPEADRRRKRAVLKGR